MSTRGKLQFKIVTGLQCVCVDIEERHLREILDMNGKEKMGNRPYPVSIPLTGLLVKLCATTYSRTVMALRRDTSFQKMGGRTQREPKLWTQPMEEVVVYHYLVLSQQGYFL